MITAFLRKKFGDYYANNYLTVPDLVHREFGFGFKDKIDLRHKAFSSGEQLKNFLTAESPLYISYSLAHYKIPDAKPMPKKDFLGCDLVFDLDHAPLSFGLFSEAYVMNVRDSALRLVEDFFPELGFSKSDASANFSGQKGFHVHVAGEALQQLGSEARRQLVEFTQAPPKSVLLKEVKLEGFKEKKLLGPTRDDAGWGKNFLDYCYAFLEKADADALRKKGIRSPEKFILEKEFILDSLLRGNWGAFKNANALWDKLYESFSKEKSVVLDAQVTVDLHRLIRLPDSLHGSTGFKAGKTDLKSFSLRDVVAFPNSQTSVKILADCAFELFDSYSFKAGETVVVPEFVAVFLECKHLGEVIV